MRKKETITESEWLAATREALSKVPPIRYRIWTEAEETIVREFYGKVSKRDIANELHRSIPAIENKAQELGLLKHQRWYGGLTGARKSVHHMVQRLHRGGKLA